MEAAATERGFVVVTPSSVPPEWNAFADPARADDFAYIHALLAEVDASLCVDRARFFVAGHSNGAAFAAFLACHEPYELAAVAMVSATTPSTCPDDVRPPVVAVAGTADPLVPYAGGPIGGSGISIPPAEDTAAGWAVHDGCDPEPAIDAPAAGVTRRTWSGCGGVVLLTVDGGTHDWPRSPFDATAAILDFFEAVP
jgi:polyhydroxybutyrate depolymerase